MSNFIRTSRLNRVVNLIRKLVEYFYAVTESGSALILFLILVIAASRALSYIAHNPPTMASGETDSWWIIVQNLIHGNGYSLCLTKYFPFCSVHNQITAMREPVPVLFFAFIAILGKESLWAATSAELVFYLVIPVFLFLLTKEWANKRTALIAAFLWAIYPPARDLIPQVSSDLLAALLVTAGILMTLRAGKTLRTRDWLLAGLLLGLAILSRSATLVIVVVILSGQFLGYLQKRLSLQKLYRTTASFMVLVGIVMAPWLIRNQITFGKPIIGSSLVGYNLYRHNYIVSTNDYLRYVAGAEGNQAVKKLISDHRDDVSGRENEAQMDSFYRTEAFKIIAAHPVRYFMLCVYRVLPLWFDWKVLEAYGKPTGMHEYLVMGFQGVLVLLAAVGIRRNILGTWTFWGSILVMSLAYMAVDSQLLYLMPVMPLLMSLSASGAESLLTKIYHALPQDGG